MDIKRRIDDWRRNLLDLSKRNPLVNCRTGGRGAIEIVYPDTESLWQSLGTDDTTMTFAWKRSLVEIDQAPLPSATGRGSRRGGGTARFRNLRIRTGPSMTRRPRIPTPHRSRIAWHLRTSTRNTC